MSQATDWGVSESGPQTPTAHAVENNDSLNALLSQHLGASRPTYAVNGTIWNKDLTGGSPPTIETYMFDGTDDILILTFNVSANTIEFNDPIGGRFQSQQIYTSSDTWPKSAGLKRIKVHVLGGGGGGGGVDGQGAGTFAAGGGGESGLYSSSVIEAASLGATETVTIGALGAGGVAGAAGSAGGTSSFGSLVDAPGGVGGSGKTASSSQSCSPGGGGTAVGAGDITAGGDPGGYGVGLTISNAGTNSGHGGSGIFGGGARGVLGDAAGIDATEYGSGGSGASVNNIATDFNGGDGSPGLIIVEEFF